MDPLLEAQLERRTAAFEKLATELPLTFQIRGKGRFRRTWSWQIQIKEPIKMLKMTSLNFWKYRGRPNNLLWGKNSRESSWKNWGKCMLKKWVNWRRKEKIDRNLKQKAQNRLRSYDRGKKSLSEFSRIWWKRFKSCKKKSTMLRPNFQGQTRRKKGF